MLSEQACLASSAQQSQVVRRRGSSGVRQIWVQIPTSSLISQVAVSQLLHFPDLRLPQPQNRHPSIIFPMGLFCELEILHIKCQAQHAKGELQIPLWTIHLDLAV